jgi:hypothetical protein
MLLPKTLQLQGGWVPSWQITVVLEPGGTTTVVFSGGFGLPLLMQPQSIAEATTSADRIFICLLHGVRLRLGVWLT